MRDPVKATILFVDDEPRTCKYFAQMFGSDYRVLVAQSVAEATPLLTQNGNDLAVLVTDQRMPGNQLGTRLLELARQQFPLVTRVFSTAYADVDAALRAVNEGAIFRYVLKPWDLNLLRQTLQESVAHHREQVQHHGLLAEKRSAMLALAGSIAHEMRTPLGGIGMGAEGLERLLPKLIQGYEWACAKGGVAEPLTRRQLDALQVLPSNFRTESAQALMAIEAMMLAVKDSRHLVGRGHEVSMSACVDDAVGRYPFRSGEQGLVELEVQENFVFRGKEELMIYVFYNLLRNALFAIKAKGGGRITIAVAAGDGLNRVRVRDTGSGIPEHALPHVFDQYYTTRPVGVGNGLGLPFCRRVMRALGGRIGVESEEGEFTEFTLFFPAAGSAAP